jgi:hypothetical protein
MTLIGSIVTLSTFTALTTTPKILVEEESEWIRDLSSSWPLWTLTRQEPSLT